MKRLITLLSLVLAMTACGQSAPSTDTTALEARSDAWETALNAKDLDALVDLYTEDTRLLPPDGEMTTGRDGVRAAFGGMMDAGLSGETTRLETTVIGDIGYIVGTFSLTAGDEAVGTGKFIETWHRGDNADHWSGPDSRSSLFKDNGAAHVHAFRAADNPNLTGLVIAVEDMDALNAMLMSEDGKAAAAEDGVRMDTMLMMTEVK